jgi:hypothetical protein
MRPGLRTRCQPAGPRRGMAREARRGCRVGSVRSFGRRGEEVGMLPAVVLGQGGARLTGFAGDGALADLAAADRKAGDSDRKAYAT